MLQVDKQQLQQVGTAKWHHDRQTTLDGPQVPIVPSHCFPAGWPLKGQIQNCPGIPGEKSRWEVQAKDFAVGLA